jgi:hypothetical protein
MTPENEAGLQLYHYSNLLKKKQEIHLNFFLLMTLRFHTKPLSKIAYSLPAAGQQYWPICQKLEPICKKSCPWWIISRKTLGMS